MMGIAVTIIENKRKILSSEDIPYLVFNIFGFINVKYTKIMNYVELPSSMFQT